ncbi:hypothetical protein ATCC90586_011830 [Pythium insidiosum]|nr:hypothetical protein ATCC90586_011830 [Pythium insidiosum]
MTEDDTTKQTNSTVSSTLFTPIVPPTITSISHADLVEWKKKRVEYEAQVRALCAHSKENEGSVMILVKDTIDRQLLKTCCELELDIEEKDLTEERLVEYLHSIVNSVKNDSLPDIDRLFAKHLRMDLKESDVKARVVKYFWKCDELISQHGLSSIFEGENCQKEKCNVLKANLSPPELHTAVQQALRFAEKEVKHTPKLL